MRPGLKCYKKIYSIEALIARHWKNSCQVCWLKNASWIEDILQLYYKKLHLNLKEDNTR